MLGDRIGYEIHDSHEQLIFKVETKFAALPGDTEEMFVTTIAANFFDRNGKLVFEANSGDEVEHIESGVKSAFGFSGGFGFVQGMNEDEITIARLMLASGGSIHRVLTGNISNQNVSLDGAALLNANISNCEVQVSSGDFVMYGKVTIEQCRFVFKGAAENIRWLVTQISGS
jgi:hypothetical protein